MDKKQITEQTSKILDDFDPAQPQLTANRLRDYWLQFAPKSTAGIKEELRKKQETVGTPVPVLKTIGKQLGKAARRQVADFLPLTRLLWDEYGREGRVVAVIPLGNMELVEPETLLPLLKELCRACVTWEDADHLAMNAVEPIVRHDPAAWLSTIKPWLQDENKWVRRTGVTVIGRLPMKHPSYAETCVNFTEPLLADPKTDVKKAVSFAIRLCARGETLPVRVFLEHHVPPKDPAATWVLCDAIRSMAKALLPEFTSLLPVYQAWAADPTLSSRDRRSVESAIKTLNKTEGV